MLKLFIILFLSSCASFKPQVTQTVTLVRHIPGDNAVMMELKNECGEIIRYRHSWVGRRNPMPIIDSARYLLHIDTNSCRKNVDGRMVCKTKVTKI